MNVFSSLSSTSINSSLLGTESEEPTKSAMKRKNESKKRKVEKDIHF
jgi:hypothetical protein